MTNGTVLVASPSAMGSAPEASGSRVPAWPARLAENSRLTMLTAWVELMLTGLSITTHPCTSALAGRRAPPELGAVWASGFAIAASLQVTFDCRGPQQGLDTL